jgi:uncharacterized membrane protein
LLSRPLLAILVLMALAGIAVSAYLTGVHYAGVPLLCTSGGFVNCAQVTTSAYSVVSGTQIPITVPGLLWFLVSGGLALVAWRSWLRHGTIPARVTLAHAVWGVAGLIAVLYLVYVEIVRLHALCEWCTSVHLLILCTFLITVYRAQQLPGDGMSDEPDQNADTLVDSD